MSGGRNIVRRRHRILAVVAILAACLTIFGGVGRADPGSVEQRIATFWARVNAMQPGDFLTTGDLGQWALNVIERDSRSRLTVADFRAATAQMQAAIDRAGPAATAPSPTPAATPRTVMTYTDGWKIALLEWGDQPSTQYTKPQTGMRFVFVRVRFDNNSVSTVRASSYDFTLQDSLGVRRDPVWYYPNRTDALNGGDVVAGAFLSGTMVFEAPVGDAGLRLIYEKYPYVQATLVLR